MPIKNNKPYSELGLARIIKNPSKNENVPSNYLLSSIKESEKERRDRNFYSFKSNTEAIKFLINKWRGV